MTSREGYYVTLARLHHACDQIVYELESWPGVQIERQQVFLRTDGIPMLYIRAKTQRDYLHIEGMPKAGQVYWYTKLTESARNKYGHKEEIIGWDNLYHERPHLHFDEDRRREYRTHLLRHILKTAHTVSLDTPHGRRMLWSALEGARHVFRRIPGKLQKLDKSLRAGCSLL